MKFRCHEFTKEEVESYKGKTILEIYKAGFITISVYGRITNHGDLADLTVNELFELLGEDHIMKMRTIGRSTVEYLKSFA